MAGPTHAKAVFRAHALIAMSPMLSLVIDEKGVSLGRIEHAYLPENNKRLPT